jgi:hypothetical protein
VKIRGFLSMLVYQYFRDALLTSRRAALLAAEALDGSQKK